MSPPEIENTISLNAAPAAILFRKYKGSQNA